MYIFFLNKLLNFNFINRFKMKNVWLQIKHLLFVEKKNKVYLNFRLMKEIDNPDLFILKNKVSKNI